MALVRRGSTQLALLAAVLAVVVAGAVLLGTCALLLTTSQEQALDAALRRADPRDVAVEGPLADVELTVEAARAAGAHADGATPTVSHEYERLTGRPARTFRTWVEDHVELFR